MEAIRKFNWLVARNMNKIFCSIMVMSAIMTACGVTPQKIRAAVNPVSVECMEMPSEDDYLEDNHATSGMFFSTENVLEEYEYDDAYCLLYDDADANMFNVEILVDLETYQMVCKAIKDGQELVGALVLNDDLSRDDMEVFTFMSEPEFEMANESAK